MVVVVVVVLVVVSVVTVVVSFVTGRCNWPQLLRCFCQRSFCLSVCLFVFGGAKKIKIDYFHISA